MLGVGKNKYFKAVGDASHAQLLRHSQQAGAGHGRVFTVDGHDQGDFAAVQIQRFRHFAHGQHARQRGAGGKSHPEEGEGKENEKDDLQAGAFFRAQRQPHLPGAQTADSGGAAKGDEAGKRGTPREGQTRTGGFAGKRLLGHVQGGVGRQGIHERGVQR